MTTGWFDPLIGADIANLIQPNTKVVFLESPGSITMEVHDVPAIVAAVRRVAPEAIIMIDNTWAAGVLFKALDFGIDISIQAATKYLIGHSDGMIGTAVANARCWEQLCENAYLMGQMVDADTAYMTSRGLRHAGRPPAPASRKQPARRRVAGAAPAGGAGQPPRPARQQGPRVLEARLHRQQRAVLVCAQQAPQRRRAGRVSRQLQPVQHGLLVGRL